MIDDDGDGIDNIFDVDYTFGVDANNDGIDDDVVIIIDTDRDGIPDYLDTDSDGDGVSDKNDSDPLNPNVGLDTDGDGIPDATDPDDDNDGVLDTIEDNCSVIVVNKTGAIITKPSTINYTFNGNTIANLIDGVDNNVYVVSGPSGTLNGPWLNFEFPSPKVLTYLEIGHYVGQTLFSTTSTYKIQGSTDNTTWTDVTGTLTYNNVATSTSGGLSTNNSNIANFPTNTTAYKYYRVFGINAASGGGWATELYFKENVCSWDIDNDGIDNDWETFYGLDPYDAADATLDNDGDTRSNLTEFNDGGNPTLADTGDATGDGLVKLDDGLFHDVHFS